MSMCSFLSKWLETVKGPVSRKMYLTRLISPYSKIYFFSQQNNYSSKKQKTLINQECWKRFGMYDATSDCQVTNNDISQFLAVLPSIIDQLTNNKTLEEIPEVADRYKMVLEYNLAGGKKLRAKTLISSYRLLASSKRDEEIYNIYILGWCVELFHLFELILDDIVDGSKLRRGRPTWFSKNNEQLLVMYDGIILYESIYTLLEKYFSTKKCYPQIINVFREVAFRTHSGQLLDNMICKKARKNVPFTEQYTSTVYNKIVVNKTSYYTYYLPIILAWYMAIKDVQKDHNVTKENIKNIALQIGNLMQVQDDFLDCYGDTNVTGKSCTYSDIVEGKCTWLIITALRNANEHQKKLLEENYGKPNKQNILAVKSLFDEIGIESNFRLYEESQVVSIRRNINQFFDSVALRMLFTNILFTIRGRKH